MAPSVRLCHVGVSEATAARPCDGASSYLGYTARHECVHGVREGPVPDRMVSADAGRQTSDRQDQKTAFRSASAEPKLPRLSALVTCGFSGWPPSSFAAAAPGDVEDVARTGREAERQRGSFGETKMLCSALLLCGLKLATPCCVQRCPHPPMLFSPAFPCSVQA